MKRVAVYIRVSTSEQCSELQRVEIEQFVRLRGWKLSHVYDDHASGTTQQRIAFKEMFEAARNRDFDILVVWKLDRFCRSLTHLVASLEELNTLGIEFISLKDQIDMTTASGRLMTHIIAAFAEFEASLIRERVMAGLANARRKGKRLGRPAKINPTVVLELRGGGMTLTEIARHLGVTKSAVSKTLKKHGLRKALIKREIIKGPDEGSDVEKT